MRLRHQKNWMYQPNNIHAAIEMTHSSFLTFSSHWAFRNYIPADGEFYMTWLRNPVDLFYSAWNYFRTETKKAARDALFEPLYTQVENMYRFKKFDAFLDAALNGMCVYPQYQFNINWEEFHFIGFAERMRDSLRRLSEALGVRVARPPKKIRQTKPSLLTSSHKHRRRQVIRLLDRELSIFRRVAADQGYGKGKDNRIMLSPNS